VDLSFIKDLINGRKLKNWMKKVKFFNKKLLWIFLLQYFIFYLDLGLIRKIKISPTKML